MREIENRRKRENERERETGMGGCYSSEEMMRTWCCYSLCVILWFLTKGR